MAITKEEWEAIAAELSRPHGRVELKCGEHIVSFQVELTKVLKYSIHTYVDGFWRGEWMDGKSEIGQEFFRRKECFARTPKEREAFIKAMGGSRCPKKYRDIANAKFVMHTYAWPSVTPLRQHYKKHHPDAEVIRIGYEPIEDDGTPLSGLKHTLSKLGLYEEDAS